MPSDAAEIAVDDALSYENLDESHDAVGPAPCLRAAAGGGGGARAAGSDGSGGSSSPSSGDGESDGESDGERAAPNVLRRARAWRRRGEGEDGKHVAGCQFQIRTGSAR